MKHPPSATAPAAASAPSVWSLSPTGQPNSASSAGIRARLHVLERRRVRRGAVQQHEVAPAGGAERVDRDAHLLQRGHPGGDDGRDPALRHRANQRQVAEVVRAVLEQRRAHVDELAQPLLAGRGAEEDDAALVAVPPQLRPRRRRQLVALEHLVLRLDDGLTLGDVLVRDRAVGDEVLGAEVLELHAVGAGVGRRVDHRVRALEVAVVVEPDLDGDEAGSPPAYAMQPAAIVCMARSYDSRGNGPDRPPARLPAVARALPQDLAGGDVRLVRPGPVPAARTGTTATGSRRPTGRSR